MRERVLALADTPPAERFALDPGTVAMVTCALVALATGVKIQRDRDGRWSVSIRKPELGSEQFGELVGKVIARL